jgi:hypothetical protein
MNADKEKWAYHHVKGDLLHLWRRKVGYVVIPTNLCVDKDGLAVMGRGLAKQFSDEIPTLKQWLGRRLRCFGNRIQVFPTARLIAVPTKQDWKDKSDLKLIESGLAQLENLIHHDKNHYGGRISHVYVPRLGCGLGGLKWGDVEPLVSKWLGNSSYFTVVSLPEEWEEQYGRGQNIDAAGNNSTRRGGKRLQPDF